MNEYIKQAKEFCEKFNTKIHINYLKTGKHFPDDKEKRDIYLVTIKRVKNGKTLEYSFNFGSSIYDTEKNQQKVKNYQTGKLEKTGRRKEIVKPSEYDVLACIQKYEIGDFDDFCFEYGYEFSTEREMIKIKNIYFAVSDEFKNINKLFNDCMDELQEIC